MRHLGLFAGIGGFELAVREMEWETVAWCEWDFFCQKILGYHFPKAKGFGDINNSDFSEYANAIDILTAGFPCQPVSHAGNRKGTEDARWGWPATRRVIKQTNPGWILLENVAGLFSILEPTSLSEVEHKEIQLFCENEAYQSSAVDRIQRRVIATIIEEIRSDGYILPTLEDGTPVILCIPACAVNAPHRRDRVWIVARHSKHNGLFAAQERRNDDQSSIKTGQNEVGQLTGTDSLQSGFTSNRSDAGSKSVRFGGQDSIYGFKPVANASTLEDAYGKSNGGSKTGNAKRRDTLPTSGNGLSINLVANANRRRQSGKKHRKAQSGQFAKTSLSGDWSNFPTEPPLCSRNDGIPSRLVGITFSKHRNESIKAYGNAIVPQVALQIFKAIQAYESQ